MFLFKVTFTDGTIRHIRASTPASAGWFLHYATLSEQVSSVVAAGIHEEEEHQPCLITRK
jgi:hypothetical protein